MKCLISLGLAVVVRLTPPAVLDLAREQAEWATNRSVSYAAATVIGAIWVLVLCAFAIWIVRAARH
jgi:hypothetical protein